MKIVMHCGGMPFNGDTITKSSLGGSESAAYYMARELSRAGHSVNLFTSSKDEGSWDGVQYIYHGDPNENAPMGDRFHAFASQSPHDVCIVQRHPHSFKLRTNARLNLLWCHDLAMYRTKFEFLQQLWNVDGILCVSEFHKKQIHDVYDIDLNFIHVIRNGVDPALFQFEEGALDKVLAKDPGEIAIVYSSRPERGLVHLVREGGIMDQLARTGMPFYLYVCNYNNTTPQMAGYYNGLYQRIAQMPNAEMVGHLPKRDLAALMSRADALVYPTEFEEVSCITAMEAMHAGLPFVSSKHAALPETCDKSGSILLGLKNNMADEGAFVSTLTRLFSEKDRKRVNTLRELQRESAKTRVWSESANDLIIDINELLRVKSASPVTAIRSMLHGSDYFAAKSRRDDLLSGLGEDASDFLKATDTEFGLFDFIEGDAQTYAEHYMNLYLNVPAAKRETLDNNSRYNTVKMLIDEEFKKRGPLRVLDYGCAHGHYLINLAKAFPTCSFVGVDIADVNVEFARAWAKDENLTNIEDVIQNDGVTYTDDSKFDVVIAAEILEHVQRAEETAQHLIGHLRADGIVIVTVPYGPWESESFDELYGWRQHVVHFSHSDLSAMFGTFREYGCFITPAGTSKLGEPLGSFVARFRNTEGAKVKALDHWTRGALHTPYRETVALCMIARNAEHNILQAIQSALPVIDEIIVGVDHTTTDRTRDVLESLRERREFEGKRILIIDIDSPLSIGFAAARNLTIERAASDWIMWLDCDETIANPINLVKYLRYNQFNGYGIKQQHLAVEPLGLLKTDFPVRVFRNRKGIQFYGVVHEHPEQQLNKGVGQVYIVPDVDIVHIGYVNEDVRRKRFTRNIDLLFRDREENPERILGKFLWLRDLAQMNMYDMERNGGQVTPEIVQRAVEGVDLFTALAADDNVPLRMLFDFINFYSQLVGVHPAAKRISFMIGFGTAAGAPINDAHVPKVSGLAHDTNIIRALNERWTREALKDYDSRYF